MLDLFYQKHGGKMINDYQHELLIFSLAVTINAQNILETGVREGTVTQALLEAIKFTKGKLTSVDIEDRSHFQFPNWNFVQSESLSFLKKTKDKYDLIYIDDWHSYDHVKCQLEFITPLVNPRSIILLHDTMYGHTEPSYNTENSHNPEFAGGGPAKAVLELDKSIWEWATIPVNHGLTILRKKV